MPRAAHEACTVIVTASTGSETPVTLRGVIWADRPDFTYPERNEGQENRMYSNISANLTGHCVFPKSKRHFESNKPKQFCKLQRQPRIGASGPAPSSVCSVPLCSLIPTLNSPHCNLAEKKNSAPKSKPLQPKLTQVYGPNPTPLRL